MFATGNYRWFTDYFLVVLPKPRRSAEGCEEATDTAITPSCVTRCGFGLVEGFGSG